jgi:hypothetical protein
LDSKHSKENARADKKANDLFTALWIGNFTERDGHSFRDKSTEGENGSNVVYLTCTVCKGDSKARVLVKEHAEIDRCTEGTDAEVDVKCSSPAC